MQYYFGINRYWVSCHDYKPKSNTKQEGSICNAVSTIDSHIPVSVDMILLFTLLNILLSRAVYCSDQTLLCHFSSIVLSLRFFPASRCRWHNWEILKQQYGRFSCLCLFKVFFPCGLKIKWLNGG